MTPSDIEQRLRFLERIGPVDRRELTQLQIEAAGVSHALFNFRQATTASGGDPAFYGCACGIPLTNLSLTYTHLSRGVLAGGAGVLCNPTPVETITTPLIFYPAGHVLATPTSPRWVSNCYILTSEGDGSNPIQNRYRARFGCGGDGQFFAQIQSYTPSVGNGNCEGGVFGGGAGGTIIDSTLTGNQNVNASTVRWTFAECNGSPFYLKFWLTCSNLLTTPSPRYAEITG